MLATTALFTANQRRTCADRSSPLNGASPPWPQVAKHLVDMCELSGQNRRQFTSRAVQKQSQGPKQAAGVPPLQAICDEWHSIIPEPELQVVFTGPLGMRPRPLIVFLRAFVENSTAASCVKLSPAAATLVQSPACAVTETAHTAIAATKPNLKIRMSPPVNFKAPLTLVDRSAVAKWSTVPITVRLTRLPPGAPDTLHNIALPLARRSAKIGRCASAVVTHFAHPNGDPRSHDRGLALQGYRPPHVRADAA